MKSNYKLIGDFIRKVDNRNTDLHVQDLRGISMSKEFRKSTSNVNGVDLSKYKIVKKWQFTCDFMSPIRVYKLPVVLHLEDFPVIVSPAYPVFEIKDTNKLLPEYLMMWMRRSEFDRYVFFRCDSAVRGGFGWNELCETQLPVPSIEKQREVVEEYNTVVDRIKLNEELNKKLEETAQAIYKEWFVDFEFPISKEYAEKIGKPELEGKPYKSNGGKLVYNDELDQDIPEGWDVKQLSEIIDYRKGKAFKSSEYEDEGIPIVKVSTFTDNSIDLTNCNYLSVDSYDEYRSYVLNPYDIVISTVGSWPQNPDSVVGKVVRVPPFADMSLLNQNAVRVKTNKVMQSYLYYCLKNKFFSDFVISGAQGSANQASITLDHVFSYCLVVPKKSFKIDLMNIFDVITVYIGKIESENLSYKDLVGVVLSKMSITL